MTRTEIVIAIGTASLSFLGALGGAYVASRLDQANWEERYNLEQRRVVLERRVALLEKTVALTNRAPTVDGLRASLNGEKELIKLNYACAAANLKKKPADLTRCKVRDIDPERIEKIGRELHSLNAEYASTATLASIYFGEKTKAALREMDEDPWQAKPAATQKLLEAMGQELTYFPK